MKYCLILTTVASLRESRKLANLLLESNLVACVSISSAVESHYHWKGKKEKANERMLHIKTRSSHFRKVSKLIQKNHTYKTPEILKIPIEQGSSAYLRWVAQETKG